MPDRSNIPARPARSDSSAAALAWLILGTLAAGVAAQLVLESPLLARAFLSPPTWQTVIGSLGGTLASEEGRVVQATLPLVRILIPAVVGTLLVWLVGAALIQWVSRRGFRETLSSWGSLGWRWWCLPGLWYLAWLAAVLTDWTAGIAVLAATVDLWWAVAVAGWLTCGVGLATKPSAGAGSHGLASREVSGRWQSGLACVVVGMFVYAVTFTLMNWQLYRGLWIPHGDSAMYEEHLWNLLHGKGFRSYLDQGLFLGEHLQVVHLGLIPAYLVWPSHLLLELAESLALASTALPVYWIARRHTGSGRAAAWLAIASLLYFPLQYLDIAIDFKTFRPIAFGVPLLLFAIDQMERRRWWSMSLLLLAALSAKEDYALVIAPLGVWMLATGGIQRLRAPAPREPADRGLMLAGASLTVLSTAYLALAVKFIIPWFRSGDTVHYARYFSQFGESPLEIATNMLTNPGLLWSELASADTVVYVLSVLVPLGLTPLLSPSRLLVGAPLLMLLCLNELSHDPPAPMHHFHAPLVPIVFWAAAAGLAQVDRMHWFRSDGEFAPNNKLTAARFACLCALCTGATIALHPLSLKFWDPGRSTYWRALYVPGPRAEKFALIEPLIPHEARVASTDFVHPRFTHHDRSYDYSDYRRTVADYEQKVPDDTEYIVIDTMHPYTLQDHGKVLTAEDLPEYRSGDWEVLPDATDGYFIVLKRRNPPPARSR